MEYWKELRKKVGHDKIMLNCAGAAIFNSEGQVLLQKRKAGELWGFPGGVMELGESFEETIIREVMEETGLQVEVKQLIGVYSKYSDSIKESYENIVFGNKSYAQFAAEIEDNIEYILSKENQ